MRKAKGSKGKERKGKAKGGKEREGKEVKGKKEVVKKKKKKKIIIIRIRSITAISSSLGSPSSSLVSVSKENSSTASSDSIFMLSTFKKKKKKKKKSVQHRFPVGQGYRMCDRMGASDRTLQTTSQNGIVVGRTVRKSTVKVKISYEPALGHDGPCGFLYLPPSNKIRICNLQATKLFKIEMPTQNLEEQAEHISCEDGQSDLDPLPPMAQIDPSFAVHVVAIFRAIIRGYAAAELDSEKEAIWHKFLNAPRDSLATVRQAIRRNPKVAHVRNDRENLEASNLSAEQRAELEIDRRSIRHALQTARAGNLGKATRILDNVYKESALTPEEKVRKLQQLHPEGDAIRIPEADFPRTGVVEKSEVRLATEKLSRGASPGPTGLSESMMRLLVDDEESCLSLCHMLRDVINGEVPLNVRKRLTRCRIIALAKPQNGIRPIAMGDTILKICGSILLQRHENALQIFFSPIQRGILQKKRMRVHRSRTFK